MKLQHLNKKRLILLDLDGTLLEPSGVKMHPKTKEVLLEAQKNGHTLCIVTGRPHRASIRFYKELGLSTLLTNFDGAHIHDPLKRQFKRIVLPISEETTKEIINNPSIKKFATNLLIENYNKAIVQKKDTFIENFFHLDDIEDDEYFIANPYTDWKGPATNVVIITDSEDSRDSLIRALEGFKHSIKVQTGAVYGNLGNDEKNKFMITITNKIVNKGFVATILAQYYNKDIRDVIAFGDQLNDLEMIKLVGYGVAMKNGNQELKNIADGITYHTNAEGGVGIFLEKLLDGEEL